MSVLNSPSSVSGPSDTTIPAPAVSIEPLAPQSKALKALHDHIKKGLPVNHPSALAAIADAVRHKDSIDDRKLLLEQALTFISRLPDGTVSHTLRNKIAELLYNDLAHPAATLLGNEHAWRAPDGGGNNIGIPDLGKANTPYSRSVQQGHPLPKNQLPDPGLVFDTLLRRTEFRPHPGGLSALMFSFAPLVIHTVFRTSHRDPNINETSSYVDLAPLYGNNADDQNKIRMRNGRGMLYPDVFCEDRLLLLPPAVCALLVLFSRNHNYIAHKLLEINERGTWKELSKFKQDDPADKVKLLQQEEEIFQTARLINCGWFAMIVFSDYFSTILGLVRYGSSWSLTPFDEMREEDHSIFPRGQGNSCSAEFNCLYRWHATTSRGNEEWTEGVFQELFPNKSPDDVTVRDFRIAAGQAAAVLPPNPQWTFGKIERQANGYFKDEDLARILQDATADPAAAFGARSTPAVMRLNEIMGIEQSRTWGVCSLNDFRRFLGLKPYDSFLEWNPDQKIADAAEKLYGDIEHLELYVGLQAEETKPLVEGAGLCPGYTISRAILSDAIALTRGDRFFTYDFTPYNLTAWGFADCQRDPNAFGFGSTLGRLLLRVLPNDYTENSVYTFFPLMTPESMKTNLTNLGILDQYDVSRPTHKTPIQTVRGYGPVASILKDKQGFSSPYKARVDRVIHGPGFFPAGDMKEQQAVASVLGSADLIDPIGKYFYNATRGLIFANSYVLVGGKSRGVDVVRDVLKIVTVQWAATDLAGIQLKTKSNPYGTYTPSSLFDALGEIYEFIFLEVEASKVMVLEAKVKKHVHSLLHLIKGGLAGTVGSRLSISALVGTISSIFSKAKTADYHAIVTKLYDLGHSTDQLANTILALMVTSTVELTLAITNAVDLYLGKPEGDAIAKVAKSSDKENLKGFVYETLRLDPSFRGVFRTANQNQSVAGKNVARGDRIFLDVASANLDDKVFKDPSTVQSSRAPKDILFDDSIVSHLGEGLTVRIISEVLRAIFGLEGLCRAPGQSGVLQRFKDQTRPELTYAYLNSAQFISEWPTSLSILYNAAQK